MNKKYQPSRKYKKNERWDIDSFTYRNENGDKVQRLVAVDAGTQKGVSVVINNNDMQSALDNLFSLAISELGKHPITIFVDDLDGFSTREFVGMVTALKAKLVKIKPFGGDKLCFAERFIFIYKSMNDLTNKEQK